MGDNPHTPVSALHRVIATLGAMAIFAVGLCAASPALHKCIHADAGTSADAGCVIALFATGVSVPHTAVAVPLPPVAWRALPSVSTAHYFPESPRYLLPPERGPPAV